MQNELIELTIRILSDTGPATPADAIYLFGQTTSNQSSAFSAAQESNAKNILILDTLPRSGYPGFASWKSELIYLGIAENRIHPVSMDDAKLLNSRTESIALVEYAKTNNIHTLEIIAPPFHQLRALMTAITIVLEMNADIAVYSRPGKPIPWTETAVHSQGKLNAPRSRLIHEELIRIETYQKKGDLASTDDVLTYLNSRDQ